MRTAAGTYDVARDFLSQTNPAGAWSYGWKSTLNGPMTLLAYHGTQPDPSGGIWEYWYRTPWSPASVYRNSGTATLSADGGQASYPPGVVWFGPGVEGNTADDNFGVIRFTVPAGAGGIYHLTTAVRSSLDGPLSSDSDFHVVLNGSEMFGQNVPPSSATGYTNALSLVEGDTLDFMVGRGLDGTEYGGGLKIYATVSTQLLQDNFNGASIDPAIWQASTPFIDSSITASNGFAVFQNRGRLLSAANLHTALDITGRFAFTGNPHDSFIVMTRCDGVSTLSPGFFEHGISFRFEIQNDLGQTNGTLAIQRYAYPDSSPLLAIADFPITSNVFYNFRITDDGTNVAWYVGDLSRPVLEAADTNQFGHQLGLYNREGAGGGTPQDAGSMVQLDYITVNSFVPPPKIIYDVSRDFSIASNPNGVWSYGWKSNLTGNFALLSLSRTYFDHGVPVEDWVLADKQMPVVYHNTSTNLTVGTGDGSYPPGTVLFIAGFDGSPQNFGVIRFTAAAPGDYLLESAVQDYLDGALSQDADYHVVVNGVEVFGQFLPPNSGTGYTNTLSLAAGDTVDFMVGRGADGHVYGSGLKIQARLSYPQTFLTDGLVAYYPFNGNADDESGNGNDGTVLGAQLATDRFGNANAAYAFNGLTDYISIPDAPSLNPPTAISVSAWIKVAESRSNCGIVGKFAADNSMLGQWVLWEGLEQTPSGFKEGFSAELAFGAISPQTGLRADFVTPHVDGLWHHLTMTYDGSVVLLYEDGIVVTSDSGGIGTLAVYAQAVEIGRYYHGLNNGGQNYYYSGLIDDVRIYNRALSSSEVQQLYALESAIVSAPVITQQPQDQTALAGTNVTISVTVTGSAPMNLQWQHKGTNIPGATSSSLVLTNVQLEDGGIYTVTITNSLGGVVSDPARLTVLAAPTILVQPKGQIGYWGKAVSFSVTARGSRPLSYQWFKDGFTIPGATSSTLDLTNLDLFAGADYFVVVSNSVNSVTSNPALLVLNAAGISLGLYPGVMVDGVVGRTYGIQYTVDVSHTNSWATLTNFTLTQPVQLWFDTSADAMAGTVPKRFYRVVAVP